MLLKLLTRLRPVPLRSLSLRLFSLPSLLRPLFASSPAASSSLLSSTSLSTCSSLSQVLATEVLHLTRRTVRWVEAAPLPGPRPRPTLLEVAGGCIFLTSHQVPSMPSG